jgi:hypothetical protein
VPALAALVRRRPSGWGALVAPLTAGWLTATFVALSMHEWMWPGRQVVLVLPCAVLAVAWWAGEVPAARPWLAAGALVGAFTFAWLTVEGLVGLTLIDDFETTTNPIYRAWRPLLPDGRGAGDFTLLRALWSGALALLVLVGVRSVRSAGTAPAGSQPKETPSCVLVPS